MAKFTPIRITENDRKEYAKLAKNAKSKINRTVKKYGTVAEQAVKDISIPKLEEFSTRKEYNQWRESIESFTNRNNQRFQFVKNEYGVSASKSYINEIARNDKTARRLAAERAAKNENNPIIIGGKVQSSIKQRREMLKRPDEMGISNLTPFNFKTVRSQNRLNTIAEARKKQADPKHYQESLEIMKENYLELLADTFNSDANDLIEKIRLIPPDEFYEMYQMFGEMEFDYIYEEDVSAGWVSLITVYVDRYLRGDVNTDLKSVGGRTRSKK